MKMWLIYTAPWDPAVLLKSNLALKWAKGEKERERAPLVKWQVVQAFEEFPVEVA